MERITKEFTMENLEEVVFNFIRKGGLMANDIKVEKEDIIVRMDLDYFKEDDFTTMEEKINNLTEDIIDELREQEEVFDCLDSYEIYLNDREVEIVISVMLED